VCDILQSGNVDFTPLSLGNTLLPLGADIYVTAVDIISVVEVTNSLSWTKTHNDEMPDWIPCDYAIVLVPPVCAIFNSGLRE